jgi:hypothetical protein
VTDKNRETCWVAIGWNEPTLIQEDPMPNRGRRHQASDITSDEDQRPLVVRPLVQTDRAHNPDDIVVDEAAIAAGVEHGGTVESRAETLQVRGNRGRKHSGPRGHHPPGRDNSKKR